MERLALRGQFIGNSARRAITPVWSVGRILPGCLIIELGGTSLSQFGSPEWPFVSCCLVEFRGLLPTIWTAAWVVRSLPLFHQLNHLAFRQGCALRAAKEGE